MRIQLFGLAAIALVGCSAAETRASEGPPPPHPGQLAVTFPPRALHPGSNTLYFTVVSYDGMRKPPAINHPLKRAEVTVRLFDGAAPTEVSAPAHFIPNGPEFTLRDGTLRRANYWVRLELPRAGAGVIEFSLAEKEESREIQAPLEVGAREADESPAF